MYLSNRTKFRIGIGLVTLPAFAFGLLIGVLLVLLLSIRPVYAAETSNVGKTATATAKITLVLHEAETDQANREGANQSSVKVIVKKGKKTIEPI